MGIQGTEVAKESSDIIILDDNFASVVKVITLLYLTLYFLESKLPVIVIVAHGELCVAFLIFFLKLYQNHLLKETRGSMFMEKECTIKYSGIGISTWVGYLFYDL